nr:hypothetical protein [Brucella anthropi]
MFVPERFAHAAADIDLLGLGSRRIELAFNVQIAANVGNHRLAGNGRTA